MGILRRNIRELDFTVLVLLLLLAVCACIAIAAATHSGVNSLIPRGIMKKQIMWEIVGIITMIVFAMVDYQAWRGIRWWLYGVSLLLLVAVFGFHAHNGAHSWISFGGQSLQPSELAKLTMILCMASFMSNIDESETPDYRLRRIWPLFVMFVIPFALIYKEPALGQALVMMAITLTMYTVFAKRSHFSILMVIVILVVGGLSVAAADFPKQTVNAIDVLVKHHLIKSYQVDRIITWLDPTYELSSSGYNIHVAEIAIGSGQLFGQGIFNGIATQGEWVPNQWTDYIFSAIGEEFGFVGTAVLVCLFLMLLLRFLTIAKSTSDRFGMYIIVGIVGMFSFQVFENIGMDMYFSPSTGITLPFISYGGTSLVIDYMAVGIVLSVGLRRHRLQFE